MVKMLKKPKAPALEFFELEYIEAMKYQNGEPLYFVKWVGYPKSSNSWEPMSSIVRCDRAIAAFCAETKVDRNVRYKDGYLVTASKEWCRQQAELNQKEEMMRRQENIQMTQKNVRPRKRKGIKKLPKRETKSRRAVSRSEPAPSSSSSISNISNPISSVLDDDDIKIEHIVEDMLILAGETFSDTEMDLDIDLPDDMDLDGMAYLSDATLSDSDGLKEKFK
ncbi:hypothetical protein C8J56DRAFT_1124056 [Mycena floridula]|nr:hypothetical protein C8J56DRAFT_1124056 [Mycena floridula]